MDENPVSQKTEPQVEQPVKKKGSFVHFISSHNRFLSFLGILAVVTALPITVIMSQNQQNAGQYASTTQTRYQQTNTDIVKTGTWSTFTKAAASGGSYGRSSTVGASATIYFIGTRLDVIAMKGTTTGIMDVYLDGNLKATINTAATTAVYQQLLWSTGEATQGAHVVKIVRNSSSANGKYLTLDAVDIWGAITPRPVPTVTPILTPTPSSTPTPVPPTPTPDPTHPTIVLDPGHSPSTCQVVKDGLVEPGAPGEMAINWTEANLLKPRLQAMGYNVVMTKQTVNDCVSNKQRAEIANQNNAALMFRIHMNAGSDCHYFMMTPTTTSPYTGLPTASNIIVDLAAARTIISALDAAKIGITHRGTTEYDYIWADSRGANAGLDPKCPHLFAGSCYSQVPVSLIELSGSGCSWLQSTANLDKAAAGIATGIKNVVPIITPTPFVPIITTAPTP